MFRHVVLLQLVPDTTAEQRQAVLDGLAELPDRIPEIRSYRIGADAGISDGNFDVAIVADFDDADAYRAYATHPVHLALIEANIKPILAGRAAVQHELA